MGFLLFILVTALLIVRCIQNDRSHEPKRVMPFFFGGLVLLIAELFYSLEMSTTLSCVLSAVQIVIFCIVGFIVWILSGPLHIQ